MRLRARYSTGSASEGVRVHDILPARAVDSTKELTMQVADSSNQLGLRAGDTVVVRSKEEILATLDAQGRLDGMPFQPEMFAFCGRTLRVGKVAHKTCDTINKTGGRRVRNAVHLEGVRCDGSAHAGCQADCNLFWKEAWLRHADA